MTARTSVTEHLDEIKRMHQRMRALIGVDAKLLAAQRRAVSAARRALKSPAGY